MPCVLPKRFTHLKDRGFTLLELLAVIAIVAVLIALSFPVVGSILTRAKVAEATSNLRQSSLALLQSANENNGQIFLVGRANTTVNFSWVQNLSIVGISPGEAAASPGIKHTANTAPNLLFNTFGCYVSDTFDPHTQRASGGSFQSRVLRPIGVDRPGSYILLGTTFSATAGGQWFTMWDTGNHSVFHTPFGNGEKATGLLGFLDGSVRPVTASEYGTLRSAMPGGASTIEYFDFERVRKTISP